MLTEKRTIGQKQAVFKVGGMPCFKVKKKPSCKHWTSTGLQNDFTKDRNAVAKHGEYFYEEIQDGY